MEVVGNFTDAVVALQPPADKYAALMDVVKNLDTYVEPPPPSAPASPSGGKTEEGEVPVMSMPKALKLAISRAADEVEYSRDDPEVRRLPCRLSAEPGQTCRGLLFDICMHVCVCVCVYACVYVSMYLNTVSLVFECEP